MFLPTLLAFFLLNHVLTEFIYHLDIHFGFLILKCSAVLTAYSLSELCCQLSLPVGQGPTMETTNTVILLHLKSEDPAAITETNIKTIAHPSFDLLFDFVLTVVTPFSTDTVDTFIKAGIQVHECIQLPVATQNVEWRFGFTPVRTSTGYRLLASRCRRRFLATR